MKFVAEAKNCRVMRVGDIKPCHLKATETQ